MADLPERGERSGAYRRAATAARGIKEEVSPQRHEDHKEEGTQRRQSEEIKRKALFSSDLRSLSSLCPFFFVVFVSLW
jgi:hypothetical protein